MQSFFFHLLWPVLAYLVGSIPLGLLVVRRVTRGDIRRMGSGNIGATNVRRIAGSGWGLVTLAGDISKGMLPVLGTILFVHAHRPWLSALTAVAAVAGHMYPLYLRFRPSGKGVATAAGAFVILAPMAALAVVPVFLLTVRWTRMVSAGSLLATAMLPPAVWFTTRSPVLTLGALTTMAMILGRHRENLERIARHAEATIDDSREP